MDEIMKNRIPSLSAKQDNDKNQKSESITKKGIMRRWWIV